MIGGLALRLLVIAILVGPLAMLISLAMSKAVLWVVISLFTIVVMSALVANWKDAPARKARIAAILESKPTFVAYASGAPKWLAAPIYAVFISFGLAFIIGQIIFGPATLHGFGGFLTREMYIWAMPVATLVATAIWKALAWHLRSRFPDKLLVFANGRGIGTSDGLVIPYARIRRIDPYGSRSQFGRDDWIEIDDGSTRKVHLNMALDPPDHILKQLRDHAIAGGANLAPALANGREPSGGSQLGYRRGYLAGE